MIDAANINDILTVVGTMVGTAVAGSLGFRRIIKSWVSEGVAISKGEAERDIVENLRGEYKRLADHNHELMIQMQKLQKEILNLHNSISSLRSENVSLKTEIERLHKVIDRLESRELK